MKTSNTRQKRLKRRPKVESLHDLIDRQELSISTKNESTNAQIGAVVAEIEAAKVDEPRVELQDDNNRENERFDHVTSAKIDAQFIADVDDTKRALEADEPSPRRRRLETRAATKICVARSRSKERQTSLENAPPSPSAQTIETADYSRKESPRASSALVSHDAAADEDGELQRVSENEASIVDDPQLSTRSFATPDDVLHKKSSSVNDDKNRSG